MGLEDLRTEVEDVNLRVSAGNVYELRRRQRLGGSKEPVVDHSLCCYSAGYSELELDLAAVVEGYSSMTVAPFL
jgi:hypothetical protein